jgi:hypothetical protein
MNYLHRGKGKKASKFKEALVAGFDYMLLYDTTAVAEICPNVNPFTA